MRLQRPFVITRLAGKRLQVVHFGGSEMDLGSVVSSSGRVGGGVDSDLNVYGSRVGLTIPTTGSVSHSKLTSNFEIDIEREALTAS